MTPLCTTCRVVVDVAEIAWNFEIEDKLVKDIKSFVS
jgi:hypothetical protein